MVFIENSKESLLVEKNITSESQYEALKLALDKNRLASKGQAEKIRTIRREHAKLAQEIRSKLSKEMGEVNRLSKEIESLKKDISSDTGASVPKTVSTVWISCMMRLLINDAPLSNYYNKAKPKQMISLLLAVPSLPYGRSC
mmetsp:Transcript_24910/g.53754  ORF Transcript_24910/g.53754 Transcript_24910/m.53754 type:complete len:142 (+) Transcript_24910:18-443(+)